MRAARGWSAAARHRDRQRKELLRSPDELAALPAARRLRGRRPGSVRRRGLGAPANRSCARATVSAHELGGASALVRPESHVPTTSRERSTDGACAERKAPPAANGRGGQRAARRRGGGRDLPAPSLRSLSSATTATSTSLRPVGIGQNTFVYAADGTSLGSIPAERNRQPVPLVEHQPLDAPAQRSRWKTAASIVTAASTTRASRALSGATSPGGGRRGRFHATQQLVRNLYISRERTVGRKLREACLAIQLNRDWSKQRILRAWMNIVYFGNRRTASRPLRRRTSRSPRAAQPSRGCDAGRASPGAFRVRPVRRSSRGACAAERRAPGDARQRGHHARPVPLGHRRARTSGYGPVSSTRRIREPYFFGYVRDELIEHYGANTVRSGGLSVYTTINPRFQRAAEISIRESLNQPGDPASARRLDQPRERRHPGDDGGDPGTQGLRVQPRRSGPAASRIDLQDLRAGDRGHEEDRPLVDVLRLGAVPLPAGPERPRLGRLDVRPLRTPAGRRSRTRRFARTTPSYAQLTVDVGPENVAATAKRMGVQTPLLAVPSLGPRLDRHLPSRSRLRLRDVGGRRRLFAADGDSEGDPSGRPRGHGSRLGHSATPPRDVRGSAYVVTKILEENVQYGTGTGAGARQAGRRQDRDHGRPRRRVVRGVHARPDDGRLGRLSAGGDPDGVASTASPSPAAASPREIWQLFMSQRLWSSAPQDWV